MSFLDSLPDEVTLVDLFWHRPDIGQPLLALHEAIMRAPSPFTAAERETIAAYVSGLNASHYCRKVHSVTAIALGADASDLDAICSLPETPIDARMAPVLDFVAKLTTDPTSVTRADVEEILAAGWNDDAVTSAIFVAALYAFMNRVVEGHGLKATDEYHRTAGQRLADIGYAGLASLLAKGQ